MPVATETTKAATENVPTIPVKKVCIAKLSVRWLQFPAVLYKLMDMLKAHGSFFFQQVEKSRSKSRSRSRSRTRSRTRSRSRSLTSFSSRSSRLNMSHNLSLSDLMNRSFGPDKAESADDDLEV